MHYGMIHNRKFVIFKCTTCGKKFATKRNLRQHTFKSHQISTGANNEEIALQVPKEYPVEKILKKRNDQDGKPEYWIKWRDYGEESNTWEPMSNLQHCKDLDSGKPIFLRLRRAKLLGKRRWPNILPSRISRWKI